LADAEKEIPETVWRRKIFMLSGKAIHCSICLASSMATLELKQG
jgi:hypothetical protein